MSIGEKFLCSAEPCQLHLPSFPLSFDITGAPLGIPIGQRAFHLRRNVGIFRTPLSRGKQEKRVKRLGPNPGKRDFCLREWKEEEGRGEERSLKSFAKGVVVAVAATRMRLAVRGLSRHQQMNKRASLTPYQGGFYV